VPAEEKSAPGQVGDRYFIKSHKISLCLALGLEQQRLFEFLVEIRRKWTSTSPSRGLWRMRIGMPPAVTPGYTKHHSYAVDSFHPLIAHHRAIAAPECFCDERCLF
jgi:hypothetical protein